MKKIAILGSTGSIGKQTLEVVRGHPGEFKVVGLACQTDSLEFKKQIKEFKPETFSIAEKDGQEAILKVATWPSAEMVVVAVVGMVGLLPTLKAIRAGKDIALATKEVMVVAGSLVNKEIRKHKIKLIPIDSEHSAIFQCLHTGEKKEVRRVILTMGKGPIAKMSRKKLKKVTMSDVLHRPAWNMGLKTSVDSATCLNKSFEVIEAKWLFDLSPNQIEIIVHPEYLCHSLVEFVDGSILGEIGAPDMRRYIQYALFYPERRKTIVVPFVDLVGRKISFEEPPFEKFPGLGLGFEALKIGGTMPAVMHGADETAVKAFVNKEIGFMDIPKIIRKTMAAHKTIHSPSLSEIIKAERWGQIFAQKALEEYKK